MPSVRVTECCVRAWPCTLSVASWNGQLFACVVLTLSPYPRPRPHGCHPVIADVQLLTQPAATPYPGNRPLTPSTFLDRELQEAFQECEEQMVSLGMLTPPQPHSPKPGTSYDAGKTAGKVMVNKSSESSSPPPIVVQPGHSNGGHGNKSTNGNSETADSRKHTVVFSFRDYILGTENNDETAEPESLKAENESKTDEEKEAPTHIQLEMPTDSVGEQPKQAVSRDQTDELREEHDDYNPTVEGNSTLDSETVIRKMNTEAKAEKGENLRDEFCPDICTKAKAGNSAIETSECSTLLRDKDALPDLPSGLQTGADKHTVEQKPNTGRQSSASDKQAAQSKEAKKKRQKKKKKTESSVETERKANTAVQSEKEVTNIGNHTGSPANVASLSDAGAVICGEDLDNRLNYTEQPEGNPTFSSPLSSSHSSQDHLTPSACSPAPNRALSQKPDQSDNQNDTPRSSNHSSDESLQREQHVTGGETSNQNTPVTAVRTAAIDLAACSDKRSDTQTHQASVTEAKILTPENHIPLSNSRTCVGESCVESVLEEALVVVTALPLTTPTLPEVIESEGEGESVRRDLVERVATVAVAESEKGAGERGTGKCLLSADGERDELRDNPSQLLLICSQEKCSLAFSAKEGQAAAEKSCTSKMPHNSAETEIKAPREATVRGSGRGLSPAHDGDAEKEPHCLEAFINTSPFGILAGPARLDHTAAGSERAAEGGGEEVVVVEEGGPVREHSSFSQPEASASGLSSAETERCPPTDVAESQLKSQSQSEPIATITESICAEEDRACQPRRQHHGAAAPPPPADTEQSYSKTNEGTRASLNQKEEGLALGHALEESLITETNYSQVFPSLTPRQPLASSEQIPVKQQVSSSQQVQPSSTAEARTVESAAELHVKAYTQSKTSSTAMSEVGVHVCDSRRGNHRVRFADTQKQMGSSSVNLKTMSVPALDCASLPPLTVHEQLRHPVSEASYTFTDFLSSKKPDIPTNPAPTKDEAAECSTTLKNVHSAKGGTGTKETEENTATDQPGSASFKTNTVDSQSVTNSQQLPGPSEKNHTGNEECFDVLQPQGSAVSDSHHLTVELVAAKEEAETQKRAAVVCLSKEEEIEEVHAESKGTVNVDQPQESPLISGSTIILEDKEGNQHSLSSASVLSSDNFNCKPLSDVDPSSASEPVALTCAASLQTKCGAPADHPIVQLGETPPNEPVSPDIMKASEPPEPTVGPADPIKDASSEVQVSEQPSTFTGQCVSNPALELRPPGPMLSHLERVSDCDASTSGKAYDCSADGVSSSVSREAEANKSREMTRTSLAEDAEISDVCVHNDDIFPKSEHFNLDTVESAAELESSVASNVNNLPLPPEPAPTRNEAANVIPLSQTVAGSTGINPIICEASIRDDLTNVSCPLNSDLPANEAYDTIKQDNAKESHIMSDQTTMLFEEQKQQAKEAAVDNQKEAADSRKPQTGTTDTMPQQSNGADKETIEETGALQPPHAHKIQKGESSLRDMKEGFECNSKTETSSLSPSSLSGPSEDTACAELKSSSEPQTVYDSSLCQIPTATLECISDTATDLSAALSQSQTIPDPNGFAQQQESHQQYLRSKYPTGAVSGGCVEGGEKANSQSQTRGPGAKRGSEEGDSSAGSVCQSGSKDESAGDASVSNEGMTGSEKGEGALPEDHRLNVPSHLDLNQSAGRNASPVGTEAGCSHVGETKQATDENESSGLDESDRGLMPDSELVSDPADKDQQKCNLSAARQDQSRKHELSENTALSVEPASQQHEATSLQISVLTASEDNHTDVLSSANRAGEIHMQSFGSALTGGKDFSAATAVKSNSGENIICEIQDTVSRPHELQSPNKTSATQNSPVEQTAIKGPDVEEITKEDKAALDAENVSGQGEEQSQIKVIDNRASGKQRVVHLPGSDKESSSGSITVSGCHSGETEVSTEAAVCHSDWSTGLSKAADGGSDATDKTTADVDTGPCVSSKRLEDCETLTHSEKPRDPASLSEPPDDTSVKPTVDGAPARDPPAEHVSVKEEAAEADRSWIQALKEAASRSQSEQVTPVDALR